MRAHPVCSSEIEIHRICVSLQIARDPQPWSVLGQGVCSYAGPIVKRRQWAPAMLARVFGKHYLVTIIFNCLKADVRHFHQTITTPGVKRVASLWFIPVDSIEELRGLEKSMGKCLDWLSVRARLSTGKIDGAWSVQIPSQQIEYTGAVMLTPDTLRLSSTPDNGLTIQLQCYPRMITLVTTPNYAGQTGLNPVPNAPHSLYYSEPYGDFSRLEVGPKPKTPEFFIDTTGKKHASNGLPGQWDTVPCVRRNGNRSLSNGYVLLPVGTFSEGIWVHLGPNNISPNFNSYNTLRCWEEGPGHWTLRLGRRDGTFCDCHITQGDLVPTEPPSKTDISRAAAELLDRMHDWDDLPESVHRIFVEGTTASLLEMLASGLAAHEKRRTIEYVQDALIAGGKAFRLPDGKLRRKPSIVGLAPLCSLVQTPKDKPCVGLRYLHM